MDGVLYLLHALPHGALLLAKLRPVDYVYLVLELFCLPSSWMYTLAILCCPGLLPGVAGSTGEKTRLVLATMCLVGILVEVGFDLLIIHGKLNL